ncbi:hypothetical protein WJX73_005460 [Symbiochloris irregularis]|uniref:Serine protease n=1 Tax=Symbiochloris irregularis TaxID=706552 RepID=A0AAW1NY78_9CHLO
MLHSRTVLRNSLHPPIARAQLGKPSLLVCYGLRHCDRTSISGAQLSRRATLTSLILGSSLLVPEKASAAIIDEKAACRAFEAAGPSVIQVAGFKAKDDSSPEQIASGILWSKFGHIVTSYQAVEGFTRSGRPAQVHIIGTPDLQALRVTGLEDKPSQEAYDAEVVAISADNNLAVLQISAPPDLLRPIQVASSAELKVGQSVFAIGSTGTSERTLSAGVLSGQRRGIPSPSGRVIAGALQTDAAVSPSASGGALVDSAGRLLGMCIGPRSSSGRSSGVNFAISADMLRRVVPNLIATGNASGRGL